MGDKSNLHKTRSKQIYGDGVANYIVEITPNSCFFRMSRFSPG